MATPKDSATTEPFTAADSMSFLTLVVEDKKLYVHKFVLARASPVFKTMLYPEPGTGFQEKDAKEIPLPKKNYYDVVQFLMQIYPEYNKEPVTDDTLVELMALADEYDVSYLVTKCETYITHQMDKLADLRPEQLVKYLWISTQYKHRLETLHPLHVQKLLKRLDDCSINETLNSPYFEMLSTEEKKRLILARCKRVDEVDRHFNERKQDLRIFLEKIKVAFGNPRYRNCDCNRVRNPTVCSECLYLQCTYFFGDLI